VLPEIAAIDLHIAIIGQMAAPYLAFGNTLKTGPLQVVRFHAFLRRHSAINKAADDLARHANDALIGGSLPFPECSNMAMRRSARAVFQQMWRQTRWAKLAAYDPVASDCFR
jgi:hypothetical protein